MTAVPDSRLGILICGSDARRDVLDRVLPSVFKFWPDCPYQIYVGLNSPSVTHTEMKVLTASPSNWRNECIQQVMQIPESYLLVLLDDYLLLEPVNQERLSKLVAFAISSRLSYLRLLPLRRSVFAGICSVLRPKAFEEITKIREKRPFYSGLQAAIWEKRHFLAMLAPEGSIWEFEHRSRPGIDHHVITNLPPIIYSHLVEKGRWLPYAATLLRRTGLPAGLGERPTWPKWMNLRLALDEIRFQVFGYANH